MNGGIPGRVQHHAQSTDDHPRGGSGQPGQRPGDHRGGGLSWDGRHRRADRGAGDHHPCAPRTSRTRRRWGRRAGHRPGRCPGHDRTAPEDVDLIAADRSTTPRGNPLLFSLLDAMDGVAADADVTFVLTTNRADILEKALIQRPGRIDLAVEVPRPDAAGRLALAHLYSGTAQVTADLAPLVLATAGAMASAIREVMRRCVLAAFADGPAADPDGPGRPAGWQWDTCAPPDQV